MSLALGIMSGTSGDGVSLALGRFSGGSFKLLGYKTFPYPKTLRRAIARPASLSLNEISSLNFELGEIFANAALKFMKENRINPKRVAVIGSHGQTLAHDPRGKIPSTFQIGESSVIAEKTGIPVVSDFRTRDVAAGGEGAPLIPFFDQFFFGQAQAKSLLNLGGIANAAIVGKNIKPIAFDTGPGNCLIDWAAGTASGGRQTLDFEGNMARRGPIHIESVRKMMRHPYFSMRPPKSAGREIFNEGFVPGNLKKLLRKRPEDVMATLTYFTAFSIFEAHRRFALPKTPVMKVIVSGGGALNRALMDPLRSLFRPIPVRSIQEFSLHPQAKEPLAFAFFALRAIRGETNHLPQGTGAKGTRILGKITPGKNFGGIS